MWSMDPTAWFGVAVEGQGFAPGAALDWQDRVMVQLETTGPSLAQGAAGLLVLVAVLLACRYVPLLLGLWRGQRLSMDGAGGPLPDEDESAWLARTGLRRSLGTPGRGRRSL